MLRNYPLYTAIYGPCLWRDLHGIYAYGTYPYVGEAVGKPLVGKPLIVS